jgi:23S rRNA-/tRNA-specific pseudouridylate synthase
MSAIGHPLVGDWLYGTEDTELIARAALHSYALHLKHPVTGEMLELYAPLPDDMQRLMLR